MTRVLVVAESAIERAGIEALLARDAALTVVGRATLGAGGAPLAQQVEELDPDVVVAALSGGGDDEGPDTPVEALARVVAGGRAALVLLSDAGGAWPAEALRAGARGLLPRDAGAEALAAAVNAAAAGLVTLHADAVAALGAEAATLAAVTPPVAANGQELTPRETEVLRMLAEGLGNKQIAGRLGISEHTVKFHLASIFTKLRASTRTEAVMLGARRGLIVV